MRLILALAAIVLCSCAVTEAINLELDLKSADDACLSALSAPALNPIREKVTLFRSTKDGPPPASMTRSVSLPTDDELRAIFEWRLMRTDCERRQDAAFHVPTSASPRLAELMNYDVEGFRAVRSAVDRYIAFLGERKVPYGEFEQKHYVLVHTAGEIEQLLRHGYRHHDQAEEDAAKSRFAALLQNWNVYLASVASRP
jgi:hypothetical protein